MTTVAWETTELATLLDQGRERGCIAESELSRAVEALDLDQEQVEAIADRMREEGVEINDDCGHRGTPPTEVTNRELAGYTTDALQLFLNEAGRHRLLSAATWRPRSAWSPPTSVSSSRSPASTRASGR